MTERVGIVVNPRTVAAAGVDHIIGNVNDAAVENDQRTADAAEANHITVIDTNDEKVKIRNVVLKIERGKKPVNVIASEERDLFLPFYFLEPEINSHSKRDLLHLECKL